MKAGSIAHCVVVFAGLVFHSSAQTTPGSGYEPGLQPIVLTNASWKVFVSLSNGAVSGIINSTDASGMNWVHAQCPWGLLELHKGTDRFVFHRPLSVKRIDALTCGSDYESNNCKLTARRTIGLQDGFTETYTLKNIDSFSLIRIPLGQEQPVLTIG